MTLFGSFSLHQTSHALKYGQDDGDHGIASTPRSYSSTGPLTSWTAILQFWLPQDEVIMRVAHWTDWPGGGLSQPDKTRFKVNILILLLFLMFKIAIWLLKSIF